MQAGEQGCVAQDLAGAPGGGAAGLVAYRAPLPPSEVWQAFLVARLSSTSTAAAVKACPASRTDQRQCASTRRV